MKTVKLTCDACGRDILDTRCVIPVIVRVETNNAGPCGDFCSHRCALKWLEAKVAAGGWMVA